MDLWSIQHAVKTVGWIKVEKNGTNQAINIFLDYKCLSLCT